MHLLCLLIILSASVRTEDCDYLYIKLGRTRNDFVDSFTKFGEDVKKFFHINLCKIEKTRERIKKAFFKFFEEVSKDTDDSNSHDQQMLKVENVNRANSFEDLVTSDGYIPESHRVVTSDGYVLRVHRILPVVNTSAGTNGIVLLHHGLLGSSDDWILLGPKKALPYLLVNAGYDVWLANARGNKYSTRHISLTSNSQAFWNFSWHEIGLYDLAAAIDYISGLNHKEIGLNFIGHSMGATALLVLLSTLPRYNRVLKTAVLMAPLAFMHDVKGPLRLMAGMYENFDLELSNLLGTREFTTPKKFSKQLIDKFCKGNMILCKNPLLLLTNGAQELGDKNLTSKIVSHSPGGSSTKTIMHYIQLIRSGQFHPYDFGHIKNNKTYGSLSPPQYRLNDVTVPVAIFSSLDDWLSTVSDIKRLKSNLPNAVMHHVVQSYEFSHVGFIWAENAYILIYYIILDILKQINTV